MGRATPPSDRNAPIESLALFWEVTPAEFETIFSAAEQKSICDAIFSEGEPVRKVSLLLSGSVKITKITPTGDEIILRVCGIGELIGGFDVLGVGLHSSTAQPIQPCKVLTWQARVFQRLVESIPTFRRNILFSMEERLRELEDRFIEITNKNVAARLSSELIRLSQRLEHRTNGNGEIHLSREELAQLTATTLYTVSRLLCRWQRLGIVTTRKGGVRVCDLPALKQLAEGRE